MMELLTSLVFIVREQKKNFWNNYLNDLVCALMGRHGIDLVLYSSKEEYPYVKQEACKLRLQFTLDLHLQQSMEQVINRLYSEYGFQITYMDINIPRSEIRIRARGYLVDDLFESNWCMLPELASDEIWLCKQI